MDLQNVILSRRSVRRYRSEAIPEEAVEAMLKAAMAAPSAVAKDPWFFYVVTQRERLDRTAEFLPYGKMLCQAPLGILVCGDLSLAHLGETGEMGYLVQDCSAAVENLMLSASAMGIGSVWLGVYPQKDRMSSLVDLYDLPDDRIPVAMISLGYPDEDIQPRTRYTQEKICRIK